MGYEIKIDIYVYITFYVLHKYLKCLSKINTNHKYVFIFTDLVDKN